MTTESFVPFSRPSVTAAETEAVEATIRSGWWTTGPRAREFEEAFADYVGASHAVAVNSCTAGLHVALGALGVGPGDLTVTSAMTFVASAEVSLYVGAVPLLLDVDPVTLNVDAGQLEVLGRVLSNESRDAALAEALSARLVPPGVAKGIRSAGAGAALKAIVPVHYAGQACDMDRIASVARDLGCAVVEDAAHAVETTYGDRKIGSISEATAFSFYATKNLATGEGGMVTTMNGELADHMRRLTLHGISGDAWSRYTAEGTWRYDVIEPGFKYNMTDIAASLGLAQLARIAEMGARRAEIVARYGERFDQLPQVETPRVVVDGVHAWHLYPLRLHLGTLDIGRDAFIEELRAAGIGTSVHFIPLHLHPYYRDRFRFEPGDYPVAAREYLRLVSLPLYPDLSDDEVERVCDAVEGVCRRHPARR